MVLPDWDRPPRPPRINLTHSDDAPSLAAPLVRLAAVVVDFGVVLAPTYVLMTAPLKRQITTAMLTGEESRVALFATLMAFVGLVLTICYQTVCHHRFGRTLGKRVFGLRVLTVEGPSAAGAQLIRSVAWLGSAAALGLPFLAVFAHARRRPLHDRAGDTLVVSDGDGAPAPASSARRFVRTAYAFAAVLLAWAALSGVRDVLAKIELERDLVGQVDQRECEVVSQNAAEDDGDDHARVRLALTLYAAGLADRSCLESEIEREVAGRVPAAPVTDLAQAFVNADDAEVSNAYLDHACAADEGAVECAMSRVVSAWSENNWTQVGETLAAAPGGSGYLEVWGVRHFLKQAQFDRALAELDTLVARPEIASFSLIERTKALFGGYREVEGRVAFAQAMAGLNADEARDLSVWTCAQELQRGCPGLRSVACGVAVKSVETLGSATSSADTLVGLRVAECASGADVDYQELAENVGAGDWQDFFRGNVKVVRRDRAAAAELFTKVLANESSADVLRVEAARRLSAIATTGQMRDLVRAWGEVEARETWVHLGNLLFASLARRGDADLALTVAETLRQDQALSPEGRRALDQLTEGPVQMRAPAAAGDE